MESRKTRWMVFSLLLLCFYSFVVHGQGIEITNVSTAGSITVTGAASIEINNGGFINNGIYTKGNETVIYSGNTSKTISGSSNTDFYNVSVTNTAGITTQIAQISANNFTISVDGKFNIDPGKSMTVGANLSNSGSLTIQSDASGSGSLIVSGTSSGNVNYNCYLTRNVWHLGSPPVENQSINTLLTTSANSIAMNGANYGVTTYDVANNNWSAFYTSATTGNFASGTGYLMRRQTTDGTVLFSGPIADQNVSVTPVTTGLNRWNLIGNPFTSAISINSGADATNFIATNYNGSSILNLDASFVAIYYWDQAQNSGSGAYEPVNHASSAFYAAPGQGFFIKANASSSTIDLPRNLQKHHGIATLKSAGAEDHSLEIIAQKDGQTSKTQIKFIEGATLGLDPGYDAGMFKNNPEISVYSKLIQDNGVDFGLQCLPTTNLNSVSIPIGLDLNSNGNVTFSMKVNNIPENLIPVLEDKVLNAKVKFTGTDGSYTANVVAPICQNRFFITFSSTTFSEQLADGLRYKVWCQNNLLKILGRTEGIARVFIYNLNGQLLLQKNWNGESEYELNISGLVEGVYLVKVIDQNKLELFKVPVIK